MKLPQTAQDFNKKHTEIKKDLLVLNHRINSRLREMIVANPDAVVLNTGKIKHTADAFLGKLSLNGLKLLDIECKIEYLEAIERYQESKEKYVQGKLF